MHGHNGTKNQVLQTLDEKKLSTPQTTLIACKRKRRMVLMDGEEDAEVSRIQPRWPLKYYLSVESLNLRPFYCSLVESALDGDEEEEEYKDIQGDLVGHQSELSRNPRWPIFVLLIHIHRFMVYWTTIVSTSYTTTYMQTSLIGFIPNDILSSSAGIAVMHCHHFLFSNPQVHSEWLHPGLEWVWPIENKPLRCASSSDHKVHGTLYITLRGWIESYTSLYSCLQKAMK